MRPLALIIRAALMGAVLALVAGLIYAIHAAAATRPVSPPLTVIRVQAPGVTLETACEYVRYAPAPGGGTSAAVAFACMAPLEGQVFRPPPRGLAGPAELHITAGDAVWSFLCRRVSVAGGFENWTGCVHG